MKQQGTAEFWDGARGFGFILILVLAWLAAWLWGVGTGRIPMAWLWALPVLNGLTFWTYWLDKDAARKRRWRVQERTLHLLALAGGWPVVGRRRSWRNGCCGTSQSSNLSRTSSSQPSRCTGPRWPCG